MEIMIQTKKNIWNIGRFGIRKVQTFNWNEMKSTFDTLAQHQTDQAKREQDTPFIKTLDEEVDKGVANAREYDKKWREKKKEALTAYKEQSQWDKTASGKGSNERAVEALNSRPLK